MTQKVDPVLKFVLVAIFGVAAGPLFARPGVYGDAPDARHAWAVHDWNRPKPGKVSPADKLGDPPSDAVVLFDGSRESFERNWCDKDGKVSRWKLGTEGDFYSEPKGKSGGDIRTRVEFGDCQLHVEYRHEADVTDGGRGPQWRGNSGIFLMGPEFGHEVQVLESYYTSRELEGRPEYIDNYADGQAGAVYAENPPLVNPQRKPGEWQAYDIVFHRAIWKDGRLLHPGSLTVFFNGVLVQDHWEMEGLTTHRRRRPLAPQPEKGPLTLQDHGARVHYRNIWYRPIPSRWDNVTHGNGTADEGAVMKLRRETAAALYAKIADPARATVDNLKALAEVIQYANEDPYRSAFESCLDACRRQKLGEKEKAEVDETLEILVRCGVLPDSAKRTDGLLLKLGVVSDIHIGGRKEAPKRLTFALEWLKAHGADAVLCPGDIANSGNIRELETFAAIWRSVFGDGRKVELMISTGNHDIAPWPGFYKDMSESERLAQQFNYKDNPSRVWERLFGEKWEPVWRKEVKGVTFVGSHWRTLHPPIERYMREHAAEFDPSKPFFYCQHAHPAGTCHGGLGFGDEGEAARALSAFPNAVAISGHTHCTLADERAVWQGAFTSIGAGCTHEGGAFEPDGHENCTAVWHSTYRQKLMAPLNDPDGQGGDPMGGCFELIDVYADRLVVHRRSSVTDAPIGPDWNVPLPSRAGGPFDPAVRNRSQPAPEFAAGAVPTVEVCPEGCPALANRGHEKDPCVRVSFPCANANAASRVFDYDIEVRTEDGSVVKTCKVNAPGGTWPEGQADVPGDCLIRLSELPSGKRLVFSVTPRNCFGRTGRSIRTKPVLVCTL